MFDPYHKWLGILPKDQPPHHYRLLSVEPFESDLDVIEGAADRQMGSVRQYQSGEHAALAARLLNEIAAARLCLLKPKSKADYDAKLRSQLKTKDAAADDGVAYSFDPELTELLSAQQQLPPKKSKPKPKAAKSSSVPLIAGGVGATVVLLVLVVVLSRGGKPIQKEAPTQREVATATPAKPDPTDPSTESKKAESPAEMQPAPPVTAEADDQPARVVTASGPPVDLIQAIDLSRDRMEGEWKKAGSSLVGSANGRIYLPAKLPEDYQLRFNVRRIAGKDSLTVGFVMSGRLGMVSFDAFDGSWSGLYVDHCDPNDSCAHRRGTFLRNDKPSTILLTVHPGHLTASIDGQTIFDWYGKPERLYFHPGHGLANRESPFIVLWKASYQLNSAELIPIEPEPQPERAARLASSTDVMPLLDVDRDAIRGTWTVSENLLHSPQSHGRLGLPVDVPQEYTFSATIELPKESRVDPVLVIGLPAGETYCSFVLKNDSFLGLEKIDGIRWDGNETRGGKGYLVPDQPAKLSCTVLNTGVRVDLDGRTVVDWRGDLHRLTPQDDWAPLDARRLFIGAFTHFKIGEIKLGPPIDPPNLPEHPPLKTSQSLDLLSLIDPTRDALSGTWAKEGTALRVMGDIPDCKLVIPFEPPPEYKLRVRIAREPGGGIANECLVFNLPIDSVMAEVFLDGWGSTISGIDVDRLHANHPLNGSSRRLQAIPAGKAEEFVMFVRKNGVKVTNGDKTIIDWTGSPNRFWMQPDRATPAGRIGLVSNHGRFRFEKFSIEPLEDSSFPAPAKLDSDGNLLSIIDVTRDSRKGQWVRSVEGIVSPAGFPGTRMNLPVAVPERYVLTADVERKKGGVQLCVGLIVGGHPCNVVIDGGGGGETAGLERLDDISFGEWGNMTRRVCPARQIQVGKRAKVQCIVLPDTVLVACDDKELIRWHGDPRRFSLENFYLPPNCSENDRSLLWLGAWDAEFLIRELTLRPLSDEDTARIASSFSGVFPTTYQATVPLSESFKLTETNVATDSEKMETNAESAPVTKSLKAGEVLQKGKWNDLINLVQLPNHVLAGVWGRQAGSLVCDPSEFARIFVPVAIRGSYELNLEFTRQTGDDTVALVLPVGTTAGSIGFSLDHGAVSGLGLIDGKPPAELPATSKAVVRPGSLENGKRTQLFVEVVQNGERVAIKSKLDDKPFLSWQGSLGQLSSPPAHAFPSLQMLGIVVNQSRTEIHKLELRVKTDGKAIVLGNDWSNANFPVAAGPPKDILADCLTFKGKKYFFGPDGMTLPMAQRLAAQLRGRLLTISSTEEEAFLHQQMSGRFLWTSAWRREGTNDWRDERNRPLRFTPTWAPGQPTNHARELWTFIHTQIKPGERGFHDCLSWDLAHTCIEWGEEDQDEK